MEPATLKIPVMSMSTAASRCVPMVLHRSTHTPCVAAAISPASATALVGEMEILIPMAGLIDKDAELARITKAMEKIEKDVSRTRGKLGNEKFVSNAPEAVIEKERAKLEEGEKALAKLKEQFETIKAL